MPWHSMILADLEFIEFRRALEREYQREMIAGGSEGIYALWPQEGRW